MINGMENGRISAPQDAHFEARRFPEKAFVLAEVKVGAQDPCPRLFAYLMNRLTG